MNQSNNTPNSSNNNRHQPPASNNEAFKTFSDVVAKLSNGRSDGVAVVGIMGMVIVFITLTIGTTFSFSVYFNTQKQQNQEYNQLLPTNENPVIK